MMIAPSDKDVSVDGIKLDIQGSELVVSVTRHYLWFEIMRVPVDGPYTTHIVTADHVNKLLEKRRRNEP